VRRPPVSAFPGGTKIIDIPEAFAAVEAQIVQQDSLGQGATAAVFLPVDAD
jgi:hypothetical protein